MVSATDDESLTARVAAGEIAAFTMLYERYAQRMYAWCVHSLGPGRAEDAVQEIFLRLWQAAAQFDPERGRFVTWFYAIARHHVLRELRRAGARRRMEVAAEIAEVLSAPQADPEALAGARDDATSLARALRLLPEEQRQVLAMAYFGGLSQSQIAAELAVPLGTVKKRVRLGMVKLRAALLPPGPAVGVAEPCANAETTP
ncbi:MAG TPA: sigma-70 family RNA polymerase sigma factor [Candidatus Dormibacteraeota bacterium]|jgi:RNA polymerase sigma-70 factor (ECF subfamily)